MAFWEKFKNRQQGLRQSKERGSESGRSLRNDEGAEAPWLVVGLGNPGREYEKTWHNLGFMVMEILSQRHKFRCDRLKFKGLGCKVRLYGQEVIFLLPQTYMNLSGECVREWARFYKVPLNRILIIVDDFDLPLGTLRIREHGSAGTHNGLRSLVACLGSEQFPRVRIGYGPKPEHIDIVDFVLQRIPEEKAETAFAAMSAAADAVELILNEGPARAMSRMNGEAQRAKARQKSDRLEKKTAELEDQAEGQKGESHQVEESFSIKESQAGQRSSDEGGNEKR